MAVTIATLSEAINEADRFIGKARIARARLNAIKTKYHGRPSKEAAAVKRASMDLTRALADLRK